MKAYCEFNRRTAQKYWFSEMEPEMQLVCLSSRAEGSDRCVELIVPKAGRGAEVKEAPEPLPLIQFDDSLLSYYPAAYLIETWALMMFIIAGEIGEDEASERMKEKIAQRSRDYHHEIEGAPEGIVSKTFADLLISFQPGRSDKGTLLEIHSCPLSAASPFCCGLFLDLLNGILSDEQGRKLEHLSMVTKGDKACRMLLTESLAKKTKTDREEPVKILRLRLARGEISEAEYLRLRELIGE
jgi:hypothetical protein